MKNFFIAVGVMAATYIGLCFILPGFYTRCLHMFDNVIYGIFCVGGIIYACIRMAHGMDKFQ